MTTPVKHPTRTKKYRALIAVGLDKEAALKAYHVAEGTHVPELTPEPQEDQVVTDLKAAGFTNKQIKQILKEQAKAPKVEPEQTEKERNEALVASRGLSFSKGRVYVTSDIIEAQVRVMKTGKSEVVATSGAGRVHSVLIFRTEGGDVAVQNLVKPV